MFVYVNSQMLVVNLVRGRFYLATVVFIVLRKQGWQSDDTFFFSKSLLSIWKVSFALYETSKLRYVREWFSCVLIKNNSVNGLQGVHTFHT